MLRAKENDTRSEQEATQSMQLHQPGSETTEREETRGNGPSLSPRQSVPVSPVVARNGTETGKEKLKLKGLEDVQPKSFLYKGPELVSVDMRGCIDLIICNQGLQEGFINPFINAYFNYNPSDRTAQTNGKRLKAATSIIAAVARRTSLASNTARKKIVTVKEETREYKTSYLVCYRPHGSSSSDRLASLRGVCKVRIVSAINGNRPSRS